MTDPQTEITLKLPLATVELILNTIADHVPYKAAAFAVNAIGTQAQEQVKAMQVAAAQPVPASAVKRVTRTAAKPANGELGGDKPVPALTRAQRRAAEREAKALAAKHAADLKGTPAPAFKRGPGRPRKVRPAA